MAAPPGISGESFPGNGLPAILSLCLQSRARLFFHEQNMNKLSMSIALWLLSGAAFAAEITVLSGGAIEPGLKAAAAAFQKQSPHNVTITFNTTPQIVKRIDGGETFDVVIAPPGAIKGFTDANKVDRGGVNVGRVGMGVLVRPGAPVPDISSADAIKRAVLEAESTVFNRASTGLYFEGLLKKMGIYEQIESKTTRYADGASVMEHILKGKGREVGFAAITEILLYKEKGVNYVGPLPAEIQNYTAYIATPMSAGSNKQAGAKLISFLGGPNGKPLFVAAGIE
jgi:molybdate transport system substrate-binding protein